MAGFVVSYYKDKSKGTQEGGDESICGDLGKLPTGGVVWTGLEGVIFL